jgi:transposase
LAERGVPPSKKNALRRGATLVFLDESGFMLTPLARRTFAPRGKTPIQKCWSRHDRISAISAITVSPRRNRLGLYFKLLGDNKNAKAEDIVDFLRLIERQLQRPLTIIWDRINIHDRASLVKAYLRRHKRIKTCRLPAYAPELNPDEGVWNHTKYARLANFAPTDRKELRKTVEQELRRLRRRKDLLASFIRHTKLPMGSGAID